MSRTTIKICGITNVQNAKEAITAGADWLGLIFVPETPRFVNIALAESIVDEVRSCSGQTRIVGVFQNAPIEDVQVTTQVLSLDAVQLHGEESKDYCLNLDIPIVKTLLLDSVLTEAELHTRAEHYLNIPNVEALLLDIPKHGMLGSILDFPRPEMLKEFILSFSCLLAGKMTPDNVAMVLEKFSPPGVDVASGVERAPGLKDVGKMKAFCDLVRKRQLQDEVRHAMQSLGFFGPYGGIYVPELLMPALEELEEAFLNASTDEIFLLEFQDLLTHYAGRPTPLYEAKNLSRLWGARIFLKREDLLHGGAHKTNNAIGQSLLAKTMGKTRLIAETGAGQHGVATAMAGAMLGLKTEIFMGSVDMERQQPNVFRMKLLGAEVHPVETGSCTLKDAINEALRDWVSHLDSTAYVIGTAAGPHPYPAMVRFFQQVIGYEAREQIQAQAGVMPDAVVACIGGGSNAIGIFQGFRDLPDVRLIGVEPAGLGLDTEHHGAVLTKGTPGCLHGMKSLALQDQDGQVRETYSIAAGLDYPLVGPEHAFLKMIGAAEYDSATDVEALEAFHTLARTEGILPALESAHALAYARRMAEMVSNPEQIILINLSGRGDKDLHQVMNHEENRHACQSANR